MYMITGLKVGKSGSLIMPKMWIVIFGSKISTFKFLNFSLKTVGKSDCSGF